jgi:hypothetical protein
MRTIAVTTWAQFEDTIGDERFRSWGFRGQGDARWPLFSSLSRYLLFAKVDRAAWSGQEERILRIFKRKAHRFLQHVPEERDGFEWLALMQHHGAPTRLLDLTWSPYVALFFAPESAATKAAIWAINAPTINEGKRTARIRGGAKVDTCKIGTWQHGDYEKYFLPGTLPFVLVGEPRIMNHRLIAQSGTFVIPGVLDEPADSILADYENGDSLVVKLVLDTAKMREEVMYRLYSMNITPATLFPDLDGLARSMAYELEYHWAFDPRTMKPHTGFPRPDKLWCWGLNCGLKKKTSSSSAFAPRQRRRRSFR